jgi:thymidine phosphorylase
VLNKKTGDKVAFGERLGTIHAQDENKARMAAELLAACYKIGPDALEKKPFIRGIVK